MYLKDLIIEILKRGGKLKSWEIAKRREPNWFNEDGSGKFLLILEWNSNNKTKNKLNN